MKPKPIKQVGLEGRIRRTWRITWLLILKARPRGLIGDFEPFCCLLPSMCIRQITDEWFKLKLIQWAGNSACCIQHMVSHQHPKSETVESNTFELIAASHAHVDKRSMQIFCGNSCESDR